MAYVFTSALLFLAAIFLFDSGLQFLGVIAFAGGIATLLLKRQEPSPQAHAHDARRKHKSKMPQGGWSGENPAESFFKEIGAIIMIPFKLLKKLFKVEEKHDEHEVELKVGTKIKIEEPHGGHGSHASHDDHGGGGHAAHGGHDAHDDHTGDHDGDHDEDGHGDEHDDGHGRH